MNEDYVLLDQKHTEEIKLQHRYAQSSSASHILRK